MFDEIAFERVQCEWDTDGKFQNERGQRLWAASQAAALRGRGGITLVSRATRLCRNTIRKGLAELSERADARTADRVRAPGGGRKRLIEDDPGLMAALESMIEPLSGASHSPLRWTCKSTKELAEKLSRQRRRMRNGTERARKLDGRTVAGLLHDAGYCLRSNRQSIIGSELPDRDTQFKFVNDQVLYFQSRRLPVIAVDTGVRVTACDWRSADLIGSTPTGAARDAVNDVDPALTSLFPNGFEDAADIRKWSSVGISLDTARMAVASIRRWWDEMGAARFPRGNKLLIVADCGGWDSQRTRAWKAALRRQADETGLTLTVAHLPRGTCKLANIAQRLLSFHSAATHLAVVTLIAEASCRRRLHVKAVLETGGYRDHIRISDEQFGTLRISPAAFNGHWNYSVKPTNFHRLI